VLTATVSLPEPQYADPGRKVTFVNETLRRLSALPGVTAAAFTTKLPLTGQFDTSFAIENWKPPAGESFPDADLRLVTSDYFRALSSSIVAGRGFQETDQAGAPLVLVVNQALARRYLQDGDPLMRRLKVGPAPWASVVGVVADLREWGLDQPARPAIYVSFTQAPLFSRLSLVVKTRGDPTSLAKAVRSEVAAIDPQLPLYDVATLETVVERSVGQRRFSADLLGLFSVMALALAAVGIYGLVSFSVTRRTRELAIRMAVGADPGRVLQMVLGQSLKLAVWGVLIGLAAGLFLSRLIASLLYGVGTFDPWTVTGVSALMLVVTLLASAVPAWRATRVNPSLALRGE
jgi:predicted permease